jgi:hypothetical protein
MCSSLLSSFTSMIYNAIADAARDGNLTVVKLLVRKYASCIIFDC